VRDPKRIDAILDVIGRMWKASPNLRLGQLLCSATTSSDDKTRGFSLSPFEAAFYLEDTALETHLLEFQDRYFADTVKRK
jgi:hypothetical protein